MKFQRGNLNRFIGQKMQFWPKYHVDVEVGFDLLCAGDGLSEPRQVGKKGRCFSKKSSLPGDDSGLNFGNGTSIMYAVWGMSI